MSQKYGRAVLGALILGALLAVALEVACPGARRWGRRPGSWSPLRLLSLRQ